MEPAVDEISEMLEGQVKIVKLDVDQNADASEAEDVTGTPTFILYRNGRKVWRVSGEMPGDVLLNKITSHI
jgi:thioredoxin 1